MEVTVFPDRAEVAREASVDLPAGVSTVQVTGLPWQVEPDSLRVSARGAPSSLGVCPSHGLGRAPGACEAQARVENLRDQNVTLVIEDRVPVSEDERIVVEKGKETTAGAEEVEDRPGVIEWSLTLAPRQRRDVVVAYSVRYPKEMRGP